MKILPWGLAVLCFYEAINSAKRVNLSKVEAKQIEDARIRIEAYGCKNCQLEAANKKRREFEDIEARLKALQRPQ